MKLFTKEQHKQLLQNSKSEFVKDNSPVVHLILPDSGYSFLLTEIHPKLPTDAYGLCDFGDGNPRMGYLDLKWITALQESFRYAVKQEPLNILNFPINVYEKAATAYGEIITDPNILAYVQVSCK